MKNGKIGVWLISMLMMVGFVCAAPNHVLISRVLYDPVGTETGGEAVEIYNPTSQSIDISECIIKTKSSAVDATIPANTSLAPESFYLIADAGWSVGKDNSSWSDADHEEALTLTNTNGGVAVVKNGTIIDSIGWGDASLIGQDLFVALDFRISFFIACFNTKQTLKFYKL